MLDHNYAILVLNFFPHAFLSTFDNLGFVYTFLLWFLNDIIYKNTDSPHFFVNREKGI